MCESLEARVATMPGVTSASASIDGLLSGGPGNGPTVVAEATNDPIHIQQTITVGPRFFETIGLPLVAGREFSTADDANTVVVISESLVRRAFGTDGAIGRRIAISRSKLPPMEVVGVVQDARLSSPHITADYAI